MWYRSGFGFIASNTRFGWVTEPSGSVTVSARFLYDVPKPPAYSWCVPLRAPPKSSVFVVFAPVFGLKNVNVLPSLDIGRSPMESWSPTPGPGRLMKLPDPPFFSRTFQSDGVPLDSVPSGFRYPGLSADGMGSASVNG